MCNENKTTDDDYRFLDYRLDQLELNLRKGQERLEQEYKENNRTILETLNIMQEGQNEQSKTLIELSQRQKTVEEKMNCIDELKEAATKNTTQILDIERRLEIYKQVLLGVGIGVGVALVIDFI